VIVTEHVSEELVYLSKFLHSW